MSGTAKPIKSFGPVQAFLDDPSVTEVMVNGGGKIFVEQKGILKKTQTHFESEDALFSLMQDIAKSLGKRLDKEQPYIDARLADGSRVNCVIPPVSIDGPALTIRKFSQSALNHTQLIANGSLDEKIAYFLNCCVQAQLNVVVCGGTGSGKTTLLNVLTSFINHNERLVTIEDAAELKPRVENLVRMEARPGDVDHKAVTIRQLVINALRMRPDRIIVGECRGAEALDMLTAMNTGHEGSMTTIHANSAREGLRRLETMVLLTGLELPVKAIRQNISSAIHLMVQVQRCPDGIRRITEIIEVGGMEGDVILTQDIFKYQKDLGFRTTGFVPQFTKIFKERGVAFPADFFTDSYKVVNRSQNK